jgi:hypothetical protein
MNMKIASLKMIVKRLPGRVTGQYLNGMLVWKIDGFSWCRQKPTSSFPFSSERPVFDSSRRETASPGGGSSLPLPPPFLGVAGFSSSPTLASASSFPTSSGSLNL